LRISITLFCLPFCLIDKFILSKVISSVNSSASSIIQVVTPCRDFRFAVWSPLDVFIPNLDDITNGEYVDLDTYIPDWDEMHKAMAVLFRPVIQNLKDKYIIEDYKGSAKYSDDMLDLP